MFLVKTVKNVVTKAENVSESSIAKQLSKLEIRTGFEFIIHVGDILEIRFPCIKSGNCIHITSNIILCCRVRIHGAHF